MKLQMSIRMALVTLLWETIILVIIYPMIQNGTEVGSMVKSWNLKVDFSLSLISGFICLSVQSSSIQYGYRNCATSARQFSWTLSHGTVRLKQDNEAVEERNKRRINMQRSPEVAKKTPEGVSVARAYRIQWVLLPLGERSSIHKYA